MNDPLLPIYCDPLNLFHDFVDFQNGDRWGETQTDAFGSGGRTRLGLDSRNETN